MSMPQLFEFSMLCMQQLETCTVLSEISVDACVHTGILGPESITRSSRLMRLIASGVVLHVFNDVF